MNHLLIKFLAVVSSLVLYCAVGVFEVAADDGASASPKRAEQPAKRGKKIFRDLGEYTYLLKATESFSPDDKTSVPFYIDKNLQALAIKAARKAYRNTFSSATYTVTEPIKAGKYRLRLVTLGEVDGECNYRVLLNNRVIGEFKNPETNINAKEFYFDVAGVSLTPGDELTVQFNAVTNGKIPEKDETAYARGRWRGLALIAES